MDVKELLKMLQGDDKVAIVDENESETIESSQETTAAADGSQNETGSEDTNAKAAE